MLDNKLWYRKPAQYWEEALPVGNGHIGAMVFGVLERHCLPGYAVAAAGSGPGKLPGTRLD